eukprot:15367019-Ditylum_brightwellii.AAC.1
MTGNNNSATFVSTASSMHNVIAQGLTFSYLDEEDEIEDKYKSIGECLQEKGVGVINAMIILVTTVKLEFMVIMNTKVYPLRQEVETLLKVIQQVEPNLQVASNNRKDKWNNRDNIPKGNDFESQLCAGLSSSVRRSGRAYVKCSLLTQQCLAPIKYSNAVFPCEKMNY